MHIEKLSREEFDAALRRGLGRALLHVRHYGDAGFEDLIEDALVFDYSYDMQIEGSRSSWLAVFLYYVGNLKTYAENLLERYSDHETLDRNLIQQIEISSILFDLGFEEFRPIVISKYKLLKSMQSSRPSRANKVINCCGSPGFAFVASREAPKKTEVDAYSDSDLDCAFILESAGEILGDREVRQYLDDWSNKNSDIKSFKDAADRYNQDTSEKVETKAAYSIDIHQLLASIESLEKQSMSHAIRFRKSASDDELKQVYENLIKCNDSQKQLRYLTIFDSRPLPEVGNEIIALLDSNERRVRRATAIALRSMTSPIIRKIAINYIDSENDEFREYAFKLLINNYKTEDHSKLEQALKCFTNEDHLHWAGMGVTEIAEKSKDMALVPALLFLFENGPDSFCRNHFLEILLKWQKCPDTILHEAQWDSSSDVQALARGKLSLNTTDLHVEGLDLQRI